jgi:hypothetical protein
MTRRFAPFAKPVARDDRPDVVPEGAADPPSFDDYPPIEQFLDELPSIDDYILGELAPVDVVDDMPLPAAVGNPEERTHDSEGWAISGWQSYDWSRLAALGRPLGDTTESDWGVHESGTGYSGARAGTSDAEEVAQALDDIAHRIRSGELPIDQFRTSPPEAAVAAALAAILRIRS